MDSLIATLWLQLTDIYGPLFVNRFGEKDSGVWYQALSDLSEIEIQAGLEAMIRDARFETWPPNCTQFRRLCINGLGDKGLPSVHKAFIEARQNLNLSNPGWSHPAIKFTVKYVGLAIMNSGRTDIAFEAFKTGYQKVCERIRRGHQVPFVHDEELCMQRKTLTKPPIKLVQLIR